MTALAILSALCALCLMVAAGAIALALKWYRIASEHRALSDQMFDNFLRQADMTNRLLTTWEPKSK